MSEAAHILYDSGLGCLETEFDCSVDSTIAQRTLIIILASIVTYAVRFMEMEFDGLVWLVCPFKDTNVKS